MTCGFAGSRSTLRRMRVTRTSMLRSKTSPSPIMRDIEQPFAGEHPVGVAREGGQQVELHRRQLQFTAVGAATAPRAIEQSSTESPNRTVERDGRRLVGASVAPGWSRRRIAWMRARNSRRSNGLAHSRRRRSPARRRGPRHRPPRSASGSARRWRRACGARSKTRLSPGMLTSRIRRSGMACASRASSSRRWRRCARRNRAGQDIPRPWRADPGSSSTITSRRPSTTGSPIEPSRSTASTTFAIFYTDAGEPAAAAIFLRETRRLIPISRHIELGCNEDRAGAV